MMETSNTEVRDLNSLPVLCQQKVLGLDVTVNYVVAMRVPEPRADLFDITHRLLQRQVSLSSCFLQITALEILKYEIMKDGASKIARGTVAEAANDVRMSHAIESDRLVLKILDQCPFKIGIEIILEKNVQRLDDDTLVRRARRRHYVVRDKDLGIAAASQLLLHVVAFVQPAIL